MWGLILIAILLALVAGFAWMSHAVCKFDFIARFLPSGKLKRWLLGALVITILMILLYVTFDFVNMVMIFLHLLIIWLACDSIALIFRYLTNRAHNHYYSGIIAFAITFIWLSIGWYNAHKVEKTEYNLTTNKNLGINGLKVVGLSDSHVGATFHWQEFEKYIDEINAEHPDIVVIMGDFVDDDTSKDDMEHCCAALGRLKTKYGVYYVYGNHDAGYWANNGRGYTLKDLDHHLTANNVKILRDETVSVVGNVYICGRLDVSRSKIDKTGRKSAKELMTTQEPSRYVICLDHEPNDYEAEAESGMDVVVSGHTHGGQFLGLGTLGVMMGANDAYYGYERRGNTDFIVSSGIGDWAIKFKTGCISEYVVININKK